MADKPDNVEESLFQHAALSVSDMSEQIAYALWGAVITTTKGFEKVEVRMDANISRIFVAVRVRWWARFERMRPLREFWIRRAEIKARQYLPTGWRLLVYYGEPGADQDGATGARSHDSARAKGDARQDRNAKREDQGSGAGAKERSGKD